MPLRTETVSLDGLEFKIQQLPGHRAFDLFTDLIGLLAPTAAKAMADDGKLELAGMDVSKLGDALGDLMQRLPRQRRNELLEELFASVMHKDSPVWPQFDLLFAGDNMFTVFKLARAALKVNYGRFGSALTEGVQKHLKVGAAAKASSSEPSPISNGQSSGSSLNA